MTTMINLPGWPDTVVAGVLVALVSEGAWERAPVSRSCAAPVPAGDTDLGGAGTAAPAAAAVVAGERRRPRGRSPRGRAARLTTKVMCALFCFVPAVYVYRGGVSARLWG